MPIPKDSNKGTLKEGPRPFVEKVEAKPMSEVLKPLKVMVAEPMSLGHETRFGERSIPAEDRRHRCYGKKPYPRDDTLGY